MATFIGNPLLQIELLFLFVESDNGENCTNRNKYQINIHFADGRGSDPIPPDDPQQDTNKDKCNARPQLMALQP